MKQHLDFRWGPIPLRLIPTCQWTPAFTVKGSLLKEPWPRSYHIYHRGLGLFLCNKAELERVGARNFHWWILDPARCRLALARWRSQVDRLFEFIRPISPRYLEGLTNDQLTKSWETFNQLVADFWRIGIVPEVAGYGAVPLLHRALVEHNVMPSKINGLMSALSTSDRLSFYQVEERDLFKIYRIRSASKRS